jgi:hypothetical protein
VSTSGNRAVPGGRRPPTRLKPESAPLLVADLTERDGDGYNRFVAIIGLAADVPCDQLSQELRAFDRGERSAVCCAIVQVGDAAEELIYMSRLPSAPLEQLLSQLGMDRRTAQMRPYSELRTLTFESLFLNTQPR